MSNIPNNDPSPDTQPGGASGTPPPGRAESGSFVLSEKIAQLKAHWANFRKRVPAAGYLFDQVKNFNWREFISMLRNRLLAGVIVAIPIVVTVWVLQIAFAFIKGVSEPYLKSVGVTPPAWASFAITLIVLLAFGFMATNVIGSRIIETLEKLMLRIPGVSTIFSATKQVMEAFRGMGSAGSFQRVVYIEYPAPGCRLLAFVTGQFDDPATGTPLTAVFLPTSPNPITGFVIIVESSRLTESMMSVEQASKFIVSGGLVTPKWTASGAPALPPEPIPVFGQSNTEPTPGLMVPHPPDVVPQTSEAQSTNPASL